MIDESIWNKVIESDLKEETLKEISKEFRVPMSFIVGRLAKVNKISYDSRIYQKYYKK